MSCSVCNLPFIPDLTRATSPMAEHTPPKGIISANEHRYFQGGYAIGTMIMGFLQPIVYFSSNMFGGNNSLIVLTFVWETDGSTMLMVHNTCANLLRRVFDAESDDLKSFTRLAELEIVLDRPQGRENAGRWKDVDYEGGPLNVDLRRFWRRGEGSGENVFDWEACSASGLEWVLGRPDVFPRFFPEVSPSRRNFDQGSATSDIFTTQPADILHTLLPYLDIPSYVALTSTCRLLHHHALTTWQPHARKLVLGLRWAVPMKVEFDAMKPESRAKLAHEVDSPHDGDWFLYLRHVHMTRSMRVRRWIWSMVEKVHETAKRKYPASGLADLADGEKSPERKKMEKLVETQASFHSMMSGIPSRSGRGKMPGIPGMMPGMMPGMPGMPGGGMPGMPSGGMPGMPSGGMPGMPSGGMPGMPSGGMPGMPSGGMPANLAEMFSSAGLFDD